MNRDSGYARAKYLDALTGLRGVAALWVALLHAWGVLFFDSDAPTVIRRGWLAVDLFFVLSGFIMCHVHLRDFADDIGRPGLRFLKLRIARIYPAHLVAVLLWLPIVAYALTVGGGSSFDSFFANYNPKKFVFAVLLLNGWGIPESDGWNYPSWSVGSEWFAYLTFPILAAGLVRIRSWLPWFWLAVFTLALTFGLALLLQGGEQYMLPESFALVRVQSEFLIGCCAYGLYRDRDCSKRGSMLTYGSLAAILLLVCVDVAATSGLAIGLLIPAFAALIVGLASKATLVARWLATKPMQFLGEISYSIYLMHALVIVVLERMFPALSPLGRGGDFVALCLYIAAIVLAGKLLHASVEMPARRYLRNRWAKEVRLQPA